MKDDQLQISIEQSKLYVKAYGEDYLELVAAVWSDEPEVETPKETFPKAKRLETPSKVVEPLPEPVPMVGRGSDRYLADVWEAIRVTTGAAIGLSVTAIFLALILSFMWLRSWSIFGCVTIAIVIACLGIPFLWRVWKSYSAGIIFSPAKNELSFPAADVENSLFEILTLKSFFDLARRETIYLSSIEYFANETDRRKHNSARIQDSIFSVNIVGAFGSRKISLNSKQKRDEFRTNLTWALRQVGSGVSDQNIDFPDQ